MALIIMILMVIVFIELILADKKDKHKVGEIFAALGASLVVCIVTRIMEG